MVRFIVAAALWALLLGAAFQPEARAQAMLENPVYHEPDVNDVDVMKYRGAYYLIGNWMGGDMLVSDNLTSWGGRRKVMTLGDVAWTEVADDLQIHACDPNYLNGVFHLYYQVYDEIGHATADSPWGPYRDENPEPMFRHTIDAELFRDADGSLYMYRTVFPGENANAGQPMADPATPLGEPRVMLRARPVSWETEDSRINEGPQVFRHRGRYYMIYNANHTDHAHGHYAFGCAEAEGPMAFSDAGKYAEPILDSARFVGGRYVYHVGQPWVQEGPNGFEKWLGYFGIYDFGSGTGYYRDETGRIPGIARLHFFGTRLYADGPSMPASEWVHHAPAEPEYRERFEGRAGPLPVEDWWALEGRWGTVEGLLRQEQRGGIAYALLDRGRSRHCLYEAWLRVGSGESGRAGLVAAYDTGGRYLMFVVDTARERLQVQLDYNGRAERLEAPLPEGFRPGDWHCLRVLRNGDRFRFFVDGIPAPGETGELLAEGFPPAQPGLVTEGCRADFDAVLYTVGWDEHGAGIREWGADPALPDAGRWETGEAGLAQTTRHGEARRFKGEPMPRYQASVQIRPGAGWDEGGAVGFYPVYVGPDDYLLARLEDARTLVLSGRRGGESLAETRHALAPRLVLPSGEQGPQEWRYTTEDPGPDWMHPDFDDSAWRRGPAPFGAGEPPNAAPTRSYWPGGGRLWLRRSFHNDAPATPFTQLRAHHRNEAAFYINGLLAADLPTHPKEPAATDFYRSFDIAGEARASLQTERQNLLAARIEHRGEGAPYFDAGLWNPKIPENLNEIGYNLLVVNIGEKLYIYINGQQTVVREEAWPPARVGLYTRDCRAAFDGILVYRLGPGRKG